jgi:hypothetical protein
MAFSQNIADVRQSQQDEMQRRSPSERLLMALELSDLCAQLNSAGKQALKETYAAGTAQKNS